MSKSIIDVAKVTLEKLSGQKIDGNFTAITDLLEYFNTHYDTKKVSNVETKIIKK